LQAEFDQRLSPDGFNIGFAFDISDVDAEDEPWTAAWPLRVALDELAANPPPLPEFDLAGIKAWLDQETRHPKSAPRQQMMMF